MMTIAEFRKKVEEELIKEYGQYHTVKEIKQALRDNEDIVQDCYECAQEPDSFGIDYEIEDAARNIAMCDL